jgi:signal transduction histidine kinase
LTVLVRDDGKGFEVADARARAVRGGSIGLLSMQERTTLVGGRFCVSSNPGGGTEVRAEFPLRHVGKYEGAQAMEVHG